MNINPNDEIFVVRTVELWNMTDEDFFGKKGVGNCVRIIYSEQLNKQYGIRSRFPANHRASGADSIDGRYRDIIDI